MIWSKEDAACHNPQKSGRTGPHGKYLSSPIVRPLEERRMGVKKKIDR